MIRCPRCNHVFIGVTELLERMNADNGRPRYAIPVNAEQVRQTVEANERKMLPSIFRPAPDAG